MTKRTSGRAAKVAVASILALGLAAQAGAAAAQDYSQGGPPPGGGYDQGGPPPQGGYGPPQGDYAPPPEGASADQGYNPDDQQRDQAYGNAYSNWAARYCIQQRQNNAAAGAVVGGVLGAIVGSGLAGRGNHAGGAIVGGALGAGAGAAIGANSGGAQSNCPPGYVVTDGAPAFAYGGYAPVYGPGWYNPWIFVGGRWTYRPTGPGTGAIPATGGPAGAVTAEPTQGGGRESPPLSPSSRCQRAPASARRGVSQKWAN